MKRAAVLLLFLTQLLGCFGGVWAQNSQILVLLPQAGGLEPLTSDRVFESVPATGEALAWPGSKPGYFSQTYLRGLWNLSSEHALIGAGLYWVPDAGTTADERTFLAALIRFLKTALFQKDEIPGASFVVEGLDLPSDLPKDPAFKLTSVQYRLGVLSGRQQLQYGLGKNLSVQLRTFFPVPVASRALGLKTLVGTSDWQWQSREVLLVPSDYWSPQSGDLLETLRPLAPGDVLRPGANSHLIQPVNPGDNVSLVLSKGSLAVEMGVQAMEAGAIGQKVRVRTDQGRVLNVEVVGMDQVRSALP